MLKQGLAGGLLSGAHHSRVLVCAGSILKGRKEGMREGRCCCSSSLASQVQLARSLPALLSVLGAPNSCMITCGASFLLPQVCSSWQSWAGRHPRFWMSPRQTGSAALWQVGGWVDGRAAQHPGWLSRVAEHCS